MRIKKKGQEGAAKTYITRNQALKLLQIPLSDFRRLCILKGVYPREPRSKKRANKGSTANTTFYYAKDIRFLLHEPVLRTFREQKAFAKKLTRAIGKADYTKAKDLKEYEPRYSLDHLVKERYPTFQNALADLDDALSMLFLFSNLPSLHKIDSATIRNCERLCAEFQHYIIRSKSLKKCFLSIKGIYYQAEIMGEKITWIVPYKFSQHIPSDVDFRIMLTFLEFYQTFVSFINYRLYTSINLVYPPKLDIEKDESGAGLSAYLIQSITDQPSAPAIQEKQIENNQPIKDTTKQLATLPSKLASLTSTIDPSTEPEIPTPSPEDDKLDTFTSADPTTTLPQPTLSTSNSLTTLFHGLHIYLSRETPVDSLTFLLLSFSVSSLSTDPTCGPHPYTDLDPRITHQICDRGRLPATIVPGRKYVQPQWIVDSINRGELLGETEYVPGTELPPHLSPFVEKREGAYDPEEAVEVSSDEEDVDELEDGDEQEEVDEESEQQRLLVAEARGEKVVERPVRGKKGKKTRGRDAEEGERDAKEMAKIMMSNKNRRLLEAMEFGNRKRKGEADKLAGRKRELIREERKRKKVKLG